MTKPAGAGRRARSVIGGCAGTQGRRASAPGGCAAAPGRRRGRSLAHGRPRSQVRAVALRELARPPRIRDCGRDYGVRGDPRSGSRFLRRDVGGREASAGEVRHGRRNGRAFRARVRARGKGRSRSWRRGSASCMQTSKAAHRAVQRFREHPLRAFRPRYTWRSGRT